LRSAFGALHFGCRLCEPLIYSARIACSASFSPEQDRDTLSDAERKAVAEADEGLKHHRPIPHEEVLAEFGMTLLWTASGLPRARALQ